MCLILFSWNAHPKYKLVVAANRDEFYMRPTAPANFWEENPEILAGKDLKAGGTWLGIEKSGFFSAVTNFRDMSSVKENAYSRGNLIKNYLLEKSSPQEYLKKIAQEKDRYNGFNLLVSDFSDFFYYSNVQDNICKLNSGIYGLSNHLLDSPWPKVVEGKRQFESVIQTENFNTDLLFELLQNVDRPSDDQLPATGISRELERALSSIFIKTEGYGTYSSTVLLVDKNGNCDFEERTYVNKDLPLLKKFTFKFSEDK